MEKKPTHKDNLVRLFGRLEDIRERWTPDGSRSAIASLMVGRPQLGAPRNTGAANVDEQPLPLRAQGEQAEALIRHAKQHVMIEGSLRRRFYRREGDPTWGQVEIWVSRCEPAGHPDQTDN